jgi:hypothetical protein
VMMQIAIAEEFGLSAHPAPSMHPASYQKLLKEMTPAHKAFMRRFARVQYENTQQELAKAGITSIKVYRGMKFHSAKPGWAAPGNHRPQLQPANSWSTRWSTSLGFGTTMLHAEIPAALVLGSARTGFGCFNESEYVILDSDGLANIKQH